YFCLKKEAIFMDTNTLNSMREVIKEKRMIKPEEAQLIREMSAVGATDNEFRTFLYLCEEYDLDPLKKEIYFIKYAGKSTILTSRDGYLKIANLNKHFDGLESDVVYQGDKLTKKEDGSLH